MDEHGESRRFGKVSMVWVSVVLHVLMCIDLKVK